MNLTASSKQVALTLRPRSVEPADGTLSLPRFLFQFVQNPLRVVPEEAYREGLVVRQRPRTGAKTAWIVDPDLIEEILVRNAGATVKSDLLKRALGRSIGDGILTSEGALWRWQRRIMAPLFRAQDIQAYVPVMANAAGEQTASWRSQGSGWKRIDQDMTGTTFSVIARTMLAGGEPAETGIIKNATERYLSHISWEIAYAIFKIPPWMPHPGSLWMRRAAHALRTSVQTLISRRRGENAASKPEAEDLLSRLLAARDPDTGEPMSDTQLVDNLLTLLEAGHETTAKALTWTLYLLARAPEWQSAARAEVKRVAGTETITAAHLLLLPIVHQVLKESMRLYPPAPAITRTFTGPLTIGGVKFNPGDNAIFPVFCIHRHRRLWTNPDCFDPTRFAADLEKTYPRMQYMPFGAGPRICLGSAFAMTEAAVLLAAFLRDAAFDWDGKHEPEPISRITLRPRGGMRLHVNVLP
ncbi:MAG: cytochrome P450 [Rhodomicrobium sp.]